MISCPDVVAGQIEILLRSANVVGRRVNLRQRQSAERSQLVEGAMAARDHRWNGIVAPALRWWG